MAKYKELHPFRDTGQPLRSRWGPPQQTHLRSKKSNGTCREDPDTLEWHKLGVSVYSVYSVGNLWRQAHSRFPHMKEIERIYSKPFATVTWKTVQELPQKTKMQVPDNDPDVQKCSRVAPGSHAKLEKAFLFLFHGHFKTFQRKLFDISWFLRPTHVYWTDRRQPSTLPLSLLPSFVPCGVVTYFVLCLVMISLFQTCQCFLAAHHWRRWRVRYKDLETSISAGTSLAKCIFTSSWSSDVQLVASSTQMQLSYVQFISSGWL